MVIGPTEPDPIVRFTRECQEMGVPYIYSPIWQIIRMSGEDLASGVQGAKVVVANDYEYELIKDKTGMDQQHILQFAEMVVTTRGKHGSLIMTQDEVAVIPPATRVRWSTRWARAMPTWAGWSTASMPGWISTGPVEWLPSPPCTPSSTTARSPMPYRARVRPAVRRDIRRRASHQRGHRRQIRSHR